MRKCLIFTLTLFLASSTLFAQEIKLGLKGGASFTDMNGKIDLAVLSLDLDGDFVTNYHAGAMVHIGITEKFAIQPEILFSAQGAKIENNQVLESLLNLTSLSSGDLQFNLKYINVPVWAKLYPVEGLALMAGPQLGFQIDSEEEINVAGVAANVDALNNSYNNVDFGLGFGAQYEFDFGLTLGANYIIGLGDVIEETSLNPIKDVRNQSIQISAGWFLF